MRKKIVMISVSFVFLAAIIFVVVHAFRQRTSEIDTVHEFIMQETFEELIDRSSCVATAEYTTKKTDEFGKTAYMFRLNDVLRGDIPEQVIHVYASSDMLFQAMDHYLLVLVRNDSLFYPHPRFSLLGNVFIPINDLSKSTMFDEPIATLTKAKDMDDVKTLFHSPKISSRGQAAGITGKKYTDATDLPGIIQASDFVLEIRVKSLEATGIYNGNPYNCEVLHVL